MKLIKLVAIFMVLYPASLFSQNVAALNGQCAKGGQTPVTQGLAASGVIPITSAAAVPAGTGVIGSYPGCTVTVYLTGTTNLATIYSTASQGTLTNPFTGNTDGSWLLFASCASSYDVTMSGAGMPQAVTLTDLNPCGSSSSAALPWVDATQSQYGYPSVDMCQAIVAARATPSCGGNSSGCYVKAPFCGKQSCSVNPFTNWLDGGVLDLRGPCSLDIRTAVQWVPTNAVHVIGMGQTASTNGGTGSTIQNTILRAMNNTIYSVGPGNFLPASEAITNSNFGTVNSQNLQTVTVTHTMCTGSAPNQGQDVVIYQSNSYTSPAQVYRGVAINILGCSGGHGSSFQIAVPTALGSTGLAPQCSSGCTLYEGLYVVHIGTLSGNQNYGIWWEGIGTDCSWILGCGNLVNDSSGELTEIHSNNFFNSGMSSIRMTPVATAAAFDGNATGGGANQSGETRDFIAKISNDICENPTCGTVTIGQGVNETTTPDAKNQSSNANPLGCYTNALLVDGPKQTTTTTLAHDGDISNFTISWADPAGSNTPVSMRNTTCGNAYANGTTPIGIETYGTSISIHDFHIEYFPAEVQIGGDIALNAAFPAFFYGTPSGLGTITVDAGGTGYPLNYVFKINGASGGCTGATGQVTGETAGVVTSVQVLNSGYGCNSSATGVSTSGGGGLTVSWTSTVQPLVETLGVSIKTANTVTTNSGGTSYLVDNNGADTNLEALNRGGSPNTVRDNNTGFTCADQTLAWYRVGSNPTSGFNNPYVSSCGNGWSSLGSILNPNLLISNQSPTISSGFGTSPSIANANGSNVFDVIVGSSPGSSGTIAFPVAASNGWNCSCSDYTSISTSIFLCRQTGYSATTATVQNFSTSGTASAWNASDHILFQCSGK